MMLFYWFVQWATLFAILVAAAVLSEKLDVIVGLLSGACP